MRRAEWGGGVPTSETAWRGAGVPAIQAEEQQRVGVGPHEQLE